MATKTRTELKAFFNTGDKPTESQFADLIDSLYNLIDNGAPSRIVSKKVLFSDINGGISPQTSLDIFFASLAQNEFISEVYYEGIDDFLDSALSYDACINIIDIANAFFVTQFATNIENGISLYAGVCSGYNFQTGIAFIPTAMKDIHNVTPRDIFLRFTSTDLTLLTQGEMNVFVKIITLPTP